MHAMHRQKVREFLEFQYTNAHHIGVLQVASKKDHEYTLAWRHLIKIYIWAM